MPARGMAWLEWFAHPENTKPIGLLIFFILFCLILVYVYGNRQRGERLESHKDIPFLDEEAEEKTAR